VNARRGWAWPLVPLYAAGLAAKDGLRAAGILRTKRLQWPVVSVGSLSAGGAGKTPVVIALAELMRERGWAVDVLSRGYGRSERGVARVDPDADGAAARFGDEPVLIAMRAGVPVWVGAERFAAGVAGEAGEAERVGAMGREADSFAALRNDKQGVLRNDKQGVLRNDKQGVLRNDKQKCVHLLDDGFQHRQLARAVDVVLVTEEDLQDAMLLAGNLREGLAALRRADVVVVREEERERVEPRVRELMREGAVVWSVRRELRFPDSDGASAGPRPVAFCAIARPNDFRSMLAQAGCEAVEMVAFDDHHAYEATDVERLVKVAGERGATGFLTTEKDAVKLSPRMMERMREVGPVCVVGLEAKFVDEGDVVREMEARIS
jgi:tetraacyldisaccharide 4'-kinase